MISNKLLKIGLKIMRNLLKPLTGRVLNLQDGLKTYRTGFKLTGHA